MTFLLVFLGLIFSSLHYVFGALATISFLITIWQFFAWVIPKFVSHKTYDSIEAAKGTENNQ